MPIDKTLFEEAPWEERYDMLTKLDKVSLISLCRESGIEFVEGETGENEAVRSLNLGKKEEESTSPFESEDVIILLQTAYNACFLSDDSFYKITDTAAKQAVSHIEAKACLKILTEIQNIPKIENLLKKENFNVLRELALLLQPEKQTAATSSIITNEFLDAAHTAIKKQSGSRFGSKLRAGLGKQSPDESAAKELKIILQRHHLFNQNYETRITPEETAAPSVRPPSR